MIAPLNLTFDLQCSTDHAFSTYTRRIDAWWPRSHTVSGDVEKIVLEPRVGGRIYETTTDGATIDWGEVTRWEPPHTLGYLWHIRRDRSDATDVLIEFATVDPTTTRMQITHSGWERVTDGALWRERNTNGWRGLIEHFRAAVGA